MSLGLKKFTACFFALFLLLNCLPRAFADYRTAAELLNKQGVKKSKDGDIKSAILDFEKALKINPFNEAALNNLAYTRNNYGVTLARQQSYSEALRQFYAAKAQKPEDIVIRLNLLSLLAALKKTEEVKQEAQEIIELRERDADVCIKAAIALEKIEETDAAANILYKLAEKQPNNEQIHSILGKLLYNAGKNSECEYHLRRCLELDGQNEEAQKMLNRAEAEAKAESKMFSQQSPHFTLKYPNDFWPDSVEGVLAMLENAYKEIGGRLNFYPRGRITVFLFKAEDFKNISGLPNWAGGVYDGRIRLYIPSVKGCEGGLKSAAWHEYTHHVINLLCSGKCPVWLNEGLAQIFEYDKMPGIELPKGLKSELTPLSALEAAFKSRLTQKEAQKLYLLSLYAAEQLVLKYGWGKTAEWLLALGQGQKVPFESLLLKAVQ